MNTSTDETREWNDAIWEAGTDRIKNNESVRARMGKAWRDADYSPDDAAANLRRGIMTPPI